MSNGRLGLEKLGAREVSGKIRVSHGRLEVFENKGVTWALRVVFETSIMRTQDGSTIIPNACYTGT